VTSVALAGTVTRAVTVAVAGTVSSVGTVTSIAVTVASTSGTVAGIVAVGAVADVRSVGSLLDLRLSLLGRCLGSVVGAISRGPDVVILSPLVVVSANLASVLLVIVLVGLDKVVGLAPPGVGISTVGVLGPGIVVGSSSRCGTGSRSLVVSSGSSTRVGLGVVRLFVVSTVTVAGTVAGAVAVGGLAVCLSATVCLSNGVTSRGVGTVGGGTVDILVTAPSLSTPLISILVVPLIVGLSIVGLGPGLLVGLVDLEILIAAPSIPLLAGVAHVRLVSRDGGGVVLATVGLAVALAVATVLGPDGSSLAVLLAILVVVTIVVLSPLVVISLEPSGVLFVVVRSGLNGIVRLAPSGILVLTVGLLGPGVVIVAGGRCCLVSRSALPGGSLVLVGLAVGTAVSRAVAGLGFTVSGLADLGGRSLSAVGRCTIDILILAPSLTAPLISIAVVPLIVRLGFV